MFIAIGVDTATWGSHESSRRDDEAAAKEDARRTALSDEQLKQEDAARVAAAKVAAQKEAAGDAEWKAVQTCLKGAALDDRASLAAVRTSRPFMTSDRSPDGCWSRCC
jgi:hypothetical protein